MAFFCDLCNKPYKGSKALGSHERVVHGKYVHYDCARCGAKLIGQLELNKHNKQCLQMLLPKVH